jgi:hypothetical protein
VVEENTADKLELNFQNCTDNLPAALIFVNDHTGGSVPGVGTAMGNFKPGFREYYGCDLAEVDRFYPPGASGICTEECSAIPKSDPHFSGGLRGLRCPLASGDWGYCAISAAAASSSWELCVAPHDEERSAGNYHVCMYIRDELQLCSDIVAQQLCAFTCLELNVVSIGENTYSGQDVFHCDGDANAAAETYATQKPWNFVRKPGNFSTSCAQLAGEDERCLDPIVASLCGPSCAGFEGARGVTYPEQGPNALGAERKAIYDTAPPRRTPLQRIEYFPADHVFWDPLATTGSNASGLCTADLGMALDRGFFALNVSTKHAPKASNAKVCAAICAADQGCQAFQFILETKRCELGVFEDACWEAPGTHCLAYAAGVIGGVDATAAFACGKLRPSCPDGQPCRGGRCTFAAAPPAPGTLDAGVLQSVLIDFGRPLVPACVSVTVTVAGENGTKGVHPCSLLTIFDSFLLVQNVSVHSDPDVSEVTFDWEGSGLAFATNATETPLAVPPGKVEVPVEPKLELASTFLVALPYARGVRTLGDADVLRLVFSGANASLPSVEVLKCYSAAFELCSATVAPLLFPNAAEAVVGPLPLGSYKIVTAGVETLVSVALDRTPPLLVPSSLELTRAGTILLEFNEPVTLAGCSGRMGIYLPASNSSMAPCSSASVLGGNKILLWGQDLSSLAAGSYNLAFEQGSVKDLAGNAIEAIPAGAGGTVTIVTTAPVVLDVIDIQGRGLAVVFSGAPPNGLTAELTDCGRTGCYNYPIPVLGPDGVAEEFEFACSPEKQSRYAILGLRCGDESRFGIDVASVVLVEPMMALFASHAVDLALFMNGTTPLYSTRIAPRAQPAPRYATSSALVRPLHTQPSQADMAHLCLQEQLCPTLTTCVLPEIRFKAEVAQLRSGGPIDTWLSLNSTGHEVQLAGVDGYYERAVVVAWAERVEASLIPDLNLATFGKEIFRPAPFHSRTRFRQISKPVDLLVVATGSPEMPYVRENFAREYVVPVGFERFVSDVIRIEAFNHSVPVDYATVDFQVFVAGRALVRAYRVDPDGSMVAIEGSEGTAQIAPDGWLSIRTLVSRGDFLVAADLDECELGVDDCVETATCGNTLGFYTCTCSSELFGDGFKSGTGCLRRTRSADRDEWVYELSHLEPLYRGWQVAELAAYETEDCSGLEIYPLAGLSASQGAMDGTKIDDLDDYELENRLDTVWTSRNLVLDPKKETAVAFTWTVYEDAKCVRIIQATCNPTAESLRLRKGVRTGREVTWISQTDYLGVEPVTEMKLGCGTKGIQYFGEVLTEIGGTPTACGCLKLCAEAKSSGCIVWKWYVETSRCILLKSLFTDAYDTRAREGTPAFPTGVSSGGWWGKSEESWPGWVSGDIGLQLRGLEPTEASSDAFDLAVVGANFPDSREVMRLKILDADQKCWESELPDTVRGVSCVGSVCGPGPIGGELDRVIFRVSILPSTEKKAYKLCFCISKCEKDYRFQEVPGELTMERSPVVWTVVTTTSTEPTQVVSRVDTFRIRIARRPQESPNPSETWRLRIVKAQLGCSQATDNQILLSEPPSTSMPDYALWTGVGFKDLTVDPGYYELCFCPGYLPGGSCASNDYIVIPGALGPVLEVVEELRVTHGRSVFHNRLYSGVAGLEATIVLDGNFLVAPLDSRVVVADDCDYVNVEGNCQVDATSTVPVCSQIAGLSAICAGLLMYECGGPSVNPVYPCCEFSINSTVANPAPIAEARLDSFDMHSWTYKVLLPTSSPASAQVCVCDALASSQTPVSGAVALRRYDERSAPVAMGTGAADLDAVRDLVSVITGSHLCALKCVSTAPLDPTCDGYRGDEGLEVLCLDFVGCEEACEREVPKTIVDPQDPNSTITTTGCVAFEIRGASRCRLIPAGAAADPATWEKQVGVAVYARQENKRTCRARDDYIFTGKLAVTQRPHAGTTRVYVDWVFNPDERGSLEVVGAGLSQHDRVMLIDPEGMCGRSAPGGFKGTLELSVLDVESSREESDALYRPLGTPDLSAFTRWRPLVEDGAGIMDSLSCSQLCGMPTSALDVQLDSEVCSELCSQSSSQLGWQPILANNTQRVAAVDRGFSSERILRFLGLRMRTGGKARVCFCDSSREACNSKEAFLFDLGFVHSSGVACLLDTPILQRATCVPQYHGALRCYDGAEAVPDYAWNVQSGAWVKTEEHALNQTHICKYVDPIEAGGEWRDVCPKAGIRWVPPYPTPKPTPATANPTPAPTDPSIICEGVTADMLPEVAGCRRLLGASWEPQGFPKLEASEL